MQIVAKSKLEVTPAQGAALLVTVKRVNEARTWLAAEAMARPERERSRAFDLHRHFYAALRERFNLPSQMAIRALADVAACFARDSQKCPAFRPTASISYDARLLTFFGTGTPNIVTIATLEGRLRLLLVTGGPNTGLLAGERCASQLVLRKGRWYLHTAVEVVADTMRAPVNGWLGVDLGIVNLAVDSDGEVYAGAQVEAVRARILALRSDLQAAGTPSARKHLKRLAGREARFRRDVNHRISRCLVRKAEGTGRGLAMEDLRGIRDRVTVRRPQRARHSSWAFHQARAFTSYKAERAGVPVLFVNPRGTSRTCPACGCCDKRNRPTRDTFRCIACGHAGPADHIASINIASRAAANRPIVPSDDHVNPSPLGNLVQLRDKPRVSTRGS